MIIIVIPLTRSIRKIIRRIIIITLIINNNNSNNNNNKNENANDSIKYLSNHVFIIIVNL